MKLSPHHKTIAVGSNEADDRLAMPFDPAQHTGRLRRLASEFYAGRAFVHWTMTVEHRATGWLDDAMHLRVREWLCHSLGRYRLLCPAYVLMPDHGHFLWMGWSELSQQQSAARLFRRCWNAQLQRGGRQLQRQPYDHVLRENERQEDAFTATAHYVFENPVRAGLVPRWEDYAFLGALAPGFPDLEVREPEYWRRFWRIFETLTRSATE